MSAARQARRGPAPIASFDRDVSDDPPREPRSAAASSCLRPPSPACPSAPRIDISRASSSSRHDSRDSSPEVALLAGEGGLCFREEGALELRSSTEELAFLEGRGGESGRGDGRRASDQPRHTRLASVGSHSSAVSEPAGGRLSVVSGVSRSPSPHRMLLETSFCGPRPLDGEPEVPLPATEASTSPALVYAPLVAAPVVAGSPVVDTLIADPPVAGPSVAGPPVADPPVAGPSCTLRPAVTSAPVHVDDDDRIERLEDVCGGDAVRIRLKPDTEYDEPARRPPATLRLPPGGPPLPTAAPPSPLAVTAPSSRKSSFCSLFRSSASPDSPPASSRSRRKKSLTETAGRARSESRSRGSVLALFRTSRRSSPVSTRVSPPPPVLPHVPPASPGERLKYYERAADDVIHIPLHTPPEERAPSPSPGHHDVAFRHPSPLPPGVPLRRTVLPDGSIIIPLHSPTEKIEFDVTPARTDRQETSSSGRVGVEIADGGGEQQVSVLVEPARRRRRRSFTTSLGDDECTFRTQLSVPDTPATEIQPDGTRSAPDDSPPTNDDTRSTEVLTKQIRTVKSPDEMRPVTDSPVEPLQSQLIGKSPDKTCPTARSPPDMSRAAVWSPDVTRVAVLSPDVTRAAAWSPDVTQAAAWSPDVSRPSAASPECTWSPDTSWPAVLSPDVPRHPGRSPSSESEPASESGPVDSAAVLDDECEKRRLVAAQESFEELPYVATTLPQERPLGEPILSVSERRGPLSLPARRPRPAAPVVHPPPGRPLAARLPWVQFEEIPERRPPPRRIETVSSPAAVYSYVPPDECRCECHHAAPAPAPDELPLLPDVATSRTTFLRYIHTSILIL